MSTKSQLDPSGNGLAQYQLGDSLGKGAFGQVYRALNWTTGETVAVKQIQLSNIPRGELGEIMSEIDLLKNLNHANIVKYKGFVKTREFLYIILEYCENGSLHNICKRFGKFPENLVAVYISQVLEGLVYLHDQGVIHRDIKGANILTNKDGSVKLADFGVASNTTTGAVNDAAVVGSPYWMAPEVIEQSGATTASDIWSVGCVVIELLEGKPPYHFLDPMPALFRIVQDDCPPIPEGASPIVKDFLYHCFQKDCNLRISAKKLLKHPWMAAARKQMSRGDVKSGAGERPLSNPNYDEAVLRLYLSSARPSHPAHTAPTRNVSSKANGPIARDRAYDPRYMSPTPMPVDAILSSSSANSLLTALKPSSASATKNTVAGSYGLVEKIQPLALASPEEQTDNWDDDFEEGISLSKLQALERSEGPERLEENAQTIRPNRSPASSGNTSLVKPPAPEISSIVEDYSDISDDGELEEKMKNSLRRGLFHPNDIKTVGLGKIEPSPLTAPLPLDQSKSMRATPIASSHSRASSVGGSVGRSDARRALSSSDFGRYTEGEDENYEDVFAKSNGAVAEQPETLQLTNRSWLGDEDSDEEDPFAEIDEGFVEDDLEANLVRDKHARLCTTVNRLIDELVPNAPDFALRDACDQLVCITLPVRSRLTESLQLAIMVEAPEMQGQMVSSHGLLAILEVLESKPARDLVTCDLGILEGFCLIGGIPVLMGFTSKKHSSECRLEASNFIRLLCHSSVLTLQMFISCRGLRVLVDLLDEDYADQTDLVVHALNGIGSVFDLHSPTPKNDFCRMFIREGLLDPLSLALLNVMASRGDATAEMKTKIIEIILVFCQVSQQDFHVRKALGTRKVVRRLLRACELLEPDFLVLMLKAVKHLSMNATLLEVLQNANALEILIRILDEQSSGPHSTEVSNHAFQTCFNLCRLNKSRQEEAAQAGIISSLKRIGETSSPLKQLALSILCDLASAGKSCRSLLWQHDGLSMYLKLLLDPYFQVSALEAILAWLQDEIARVEDVLAHPESTQALLNAFVTAKANSFENLLDPFLKICRISTTVTIGVAKAEFFHRIIDRLSHSKAVVRLNLLRILRTVCDVHPDRACLVERYGIYNIVEKLSRQDGAVLVRELAKEIMPVVTPPQGLKASSTPKSSVAPKKRGHGVRRTASDVGLGSPMTAMRTKVRPSRQKLGEIPWQTSEEVVIPARPRR
ncbi:hypothetical protein JB92DRAFT_3083136 [Gautieria morchelliformis]|nr:hypothetical protein JB92DRAFT_3083136 [Gautieria morchelliformis]